jgi:hypothetical protein
MKLLITITIMLVCNFNSCNSAKNNNQEIYQKYIGKSINYFLEQNNDYSKLIINEGKPRVAISLLVIYPNSVTIELFPKEFKYMKPFDEFGKWNLEHFRKETIATIRILQNDSVINVIPYNENLFNPID